MHDGRKLVRLDSDRETEDTGKGPVPEPSSGDQCGSDERCSDPDGRRVRETRLGVRQLELTNEVEDT